MGVRHHSRHELSRQSEEQHVAVQDGSGDHLGFVVGCALVLRPFTRWFYRYRHAFLCVAGYLLAVGLFRVAGVFVWWHFAERCSEGWLFHFHRRYGRDWSSRLVFCQRRRSIAPDGKESEVRL